MKILTSNQLPYFLFIALPPLLSFLYAISVQAFLAGWHECSWTHLAKPITIRLTFLMVAIAIVLTFPTNDAKDSSMMVMMVPYIFPAIILTVLSTIQIYRIRKYFVQGPVPQFKNMDGKVVLITGSNTGIGKETARQMLDMGATVIMACRSEQRAKAAMEDILSSADKKQDGLIKSSFKSVKERLIFLQCDVSDFESVRKAVSRFNEMELPLNVLITNAGIMMGERKTTTGDEKGIELNMACNHLGHFLLINSLLPKMSLQEDGRVVIVTSSTYALANEGIDLNDLNCERKKYTMFSQYAQSKLANILTGKELCRREISKSMVDGNDTLFPISVFIVHPGLVRTDVVRNMPWYLKYPNMVFGFVLLTLQKSPTAGAYSNVFCATSDEAKKFNGEYFSNSKPYPTNDFANDADAAKKLWKQSEDLVGLNK